MSTTFLSRIEDLGHWLDQKFTTGLRGYHILIFIILFWLIKRFDFDFHDEPPPVIDISIKDMLERPREVFEEAMRKDGPVIGFRRLGRIDYLVSHIYFQSLLTDEDRFDAHRALARIVNLGPVTTVYVNLLQDMTRLVRDGFVAKMDVGLKRVAPIIQRSVRNLIKEGSINKAVTGEPVVDLLSGVHTAFTASTVSLLFGEGTDKDSQLVEICKGVAKRMEFASGIHIHSQAWFLRYHRLYMAWAWTQFTVYIVLKYFRHVVPVIYVMFRQCNAAESSTKDISIVRMALVQQRDRSTGKIPLRALISVILSTIGIIFAAIHQTYVVAVWVIYELALRPEYIPLIREEIFHVLKESVDTNDGNISGFSEPQLRKMVRLDSFIREVMRTKGDLMSTVRETTCRIHIHDYVIPKGRLVIPLTTLSHMNSEFQGFPAEGFDGMRWVGTEHLSSSASSRHLSFGLGRFVCPGRLFAVAEMKLLIICMLAMATPELTANGYTVRDKMNTMSVPPEGTLLLRPLEVPILRDSDL